MLDKYQEAVVKALWSILRNGTYRGGISEEYPVMVVDSVRYYLQEATVSHDGALSVLWFFREDKSKTEFNLDADCLVEISSWKIKPITMVTNTLVAALKSMVEEIEE